MIQCWHYCHQSAIDSVQGFNATTSNFDAEFSQRRRGRPGGNKVRNEPDSWVGFEFFRNNISRRDPFNQPTTVPTFTGINLAGPRRPIARIRCLHFSTIRISPAQSGSTESVCRPRRNEGRSPRFGMNIYDPTTGNPDELAEHSSSRLQIQRAQTSILFARLQPGVQRHPTSRISAPPQIFSHHVRTFAKTNAGNPTDIILHEWNTGIQHEPVCRPV